MTLNFRLRNIFYVTSLVLSVWFLYLVRSILTPFILAIIFAYIFNPLISLSEKKLRFPRTISILIVYIILIGSAIFIVDLFTRSIFGEFVSITTNFNNFLTSIKTELNTLPEWLSPYVADYIDFFSKNQPFGKSPSPIPLFSRAFFGVVNFFVFLFSSFFFLKDGGKMIDRLLLLVPSEYRVDASILLKRINNVLSKYLRGQMILIASMIIMLFLSFHFLGVKYALSISIFSSLFEIVPIIGPIAAGIVGTFIIIISGGITAFEVNQLQTVLIVAIVYLVSRYLQDYLILPYVIGKVTKLHPLIILFSVLAGERIYGVIGVLLAVPTAATIKIVFGFILDKINEKNTVKNSSKFAS